MGYEIQLRIQRILNGILSILVVIFCILCGAYALFALYDNQRIYSQAENVQADMLKLKPRQQEGASFQELLKVNPEVRAWISMEQTKIDFPVLQGENNLCYVNQDVYGNFSISGSIFLDYRNRPDFGDRYNLLYGHHMENSNMFGDLDKYKEEDFFRQYPRGELILPEGSYSLRVFAVLLVQASDPVVFSPQPWDHAWQENMDYVRENAMHVDRALLESLTEDSQILALSTCSSEFTDARTVVLTRMEPKND